MRRLLVLFFTPYFTGPPRLDGLPPEAEWSTDRERLSEADIVVFHLPNWRPRRLPFKRRGQLYVAWSLESEVNYPALSDPAFMARFDIEMSYRQRAEVWTPYLPLFAKWDALQAAPLPEKPEAAPLCMFISAPAPHSDRADYAAQLFRYMRIDSYGRLLHSRDLGIPDTGGTARWKTQQRYRFSFAFENSIAVDYVTEKFFDPLMFGTVPVYRGAPNVAEFAPEHSYIDVNAFDGPKALAQYLNHLSVSPDDYARYFEWRRKPLPPHLVSKLERSATRSFPRLLEVVNQKAGLPSPSLWRRLIERVGLNPVWASR